MSAAMTLQCVAQYIAHLLQRPTPDDEATAIGERVCLAILAGELTTLAANVATGHVQQ